MKPTFSNTTSTPAILLVTFLSSSAYNFIYSFNDKNKSIHTYFFWAVLLLSVQKTVGQLDSSSYKSWTLLGGIHYQKNVFAEVGIAKALYGLNGHHPYCSSMAASSEVMISDKSLVVAPKISVRATGGLSIGLNLIDYTDFQKSSVVFRPDIGFGLYQYAFIYGYNIRLTNPDFQYVNRHTFSLVIMFFKNKMERLQEDK